MHHAQISTILAAQGRRFGRNLPRFFPAWVTCPPDCSRNRHEQRLGHCSSQTLPNAPQLIEARLRRGLGAISRHPEGLHGIEIPSRRFEANIL
jgi:hypothetical protein